MTVRVVRVRSTSRAPLTPGPAVDCACCALGETRAERDPIDVDAGGEAGRGGDPVGVGAERERSVDGIAQGDVDRGAGGEGGHLLAGDGEPHRHAVDLDEVGATRLEVGHRRPQEGEAGDLGDRCGQLYGLGPATVGGRA